MLFLGKSRIPAYKVVPGVGVACQVKKRLIFPDGEMQREDLVEEQSARYCMKVL